MRNILLALFLCFCFVSTFTTNPRSVKVELETSLLLQPGEEENFSLLNKIRNFIDQVEKAITPVKSFLRATDDKKDVFSKFLEKQTEMLLKYDDKDLQEIAKILTDEVENILDSIDVFSDKTKKSTLNILKEYRKVDGKLIRKNLQNALNGNEAILTTLAKEINSHFDNNDKIQLEGLIEKTAKFVKPRHVKLESKSDKPKSEEIKKTLRGFLNILKEKFDSFDETTKIQASKDIGNLLQVFDVNKIYLNEYYKQRELETKKQSVPKKYHKSSELNENKKDIILNENVEINVNTRRNAKDNAEKTSQGNYLKDNDFEKNRLDNRSVDLSTVLDDS